MRFILASAVFINILMLNHLSSFGQSNKVYVLLYNYGTNNEGIYSNKIDKINNIIMFESQADANSFAAQLKIQKFPVPTVKAIDTEEILGFCRAERHTCQLIPAGLNIIPPTDSLSPAQRDYKLLPKPRKNGSR